MVADPGSRNKDVTAYQHAGVSFTELVPQTRTMGAVPREEISRLRCGVPAPVLLALTLSRAAVLTLGRAKASGWGRGVSWDGDLEGVDGCGEVNGRGRYG